MSASTFKADLHMHSTCSDGKYSPSELVHRAKNYGMSCIAITDHDTMEGVDEAIETGLALGVEVIPAVEVTASYNDKECHVLCYGVERRNEGWRSMLQAQQRIRKSRADRILGKLSEMGVYLNIEDVIAEDADVITRPHIAQALVKSGHATHSRDAFDRFIGNMAPAYVPLDHIQLVDLIKLAHLAGGVAILAHPGSHYTQSQLDDMISLGIDGFEYLHPSHGYTLQTKYRALADQHDLLTTAGSDFHGFRFQDFSYFGYIHANFDMVTKMKNRCMAIKSAFLAIES
jgi:predicted metal-dependent phosphoesterase TrpH